MTINPYESAPHAQAWQLPSTEKKHSGPGVASFVLSILIGLFIFALFIVAGLMAASSGRELRDDSTEAIVVGLGIIGLLMLDFVAFALGVAGLCHSNRQKIFAALGSLFSLAIGFWSSVLIVFGF